MFKRLKEKITEEVSKSPLRLQTVQTQIGQYSPFNGAAKKSSDSLGSSESDAPTQNDGQNLIDLQENSSSIMDVSESQQFSIADEDGASSATASPIPQTQIQKFENVDLTANISALAGSVGRPRASSVSSTGSQPSFFPIYSPMQSSYSIQSDLESTSEMEDAGVNLDIISKEQLYQAFQKAKAKYTRYKARYGDVVKAYREQVNEKEKIKTILTESQDKALRRISELREQSQLEQKAKAHLEDSFRVTLEEKDELLRVLQTQIRLLKNGEVATEKQDDDDTQNHLVDISDPVKGDNEDTLEESMQFKIKTYEETIVKLKSLLKNCKDTIVKHRENNVRLAAEKNHLAEKLSEANAHLKHFMEEKSEKDRDLLNELMQASQMIENLKTKEAEDALSMAETKRLMHEDMEGKEKMLQDLKVELQQLHVNKEELLKTVEEKCSEISEIELKCKNEVELAKQRLEEAEKMLEDEKQNLLQELSRGKVAAIQLMQQEADKRLKEMEDEKSTALQSLELEWQAKMQENVKEEIENLMKQDALESTITMSDHFTNQIATLKREVQEKEAQLKHLIEEKTLFQEQIQEQCSKQAAMENEISQITLANHALHEEFNHLQKASGSHPLLAFKDAITTQFNDLRNWIVNMRLDVSEHINESSEWLSEINSEVFKLSQTHNSEMEPLIGAIESLKLENENYAKENVRFKDDFDAAQLKIDYLEEELANSNAASENSVKEIVHIHEDLDAAQQRIAHLEGQLNGSNAALEQLQAQLNVGETELKSAQEKLTAVSEHLRQLENERESVHQQLACLQLLRDDLIVLNARCEQSGNDIAALQIELEGKDAEIVDLVARNDQLCSSCEIMEGLKAGVLARDSKISNLEKALSELSQQKQSVELELKELQDAWDASSAEHTLAIENVNERLRMEAERNESLFKMQSASSTAPMESKTLDCNVDAEAVHPSLEAECEHETQLLEANQQLTLELDNVKNVTETLRSEADFLREQLNTSKSEYEQRVGQLSSEIEAKQLKLQGLESLRDSQENASLAVENLQRTCAALEEERNDLSARLADKDAVLRQIEEEKNSGSAKLAEHVALLQQLKDEKKELSSKLVENAELFQRLEEEKSDLSTSLEEKVALSIQLEEEKNDWNAKLTKHVTVLQQLEEERNDLSIKLTEHVAALQKLEEEKGNSNAKLLETIALAGRLEAELEASRSSEEGLGKLKSDLEKCQDALLVKTGLGEELTAKVNSLESMLAEVAQKAVQAQLLEGEIVQLGELITALRTQIRALSKEKENLEKTKSELSEVNASQMNKVCEIEEKLDLAEAELLAAERRHSEEMESFEKSYKDKMNELVHRCKNKLLTTKQEHAEQMSITVEDLEVKVRNLKAEHSMLSEQFDLARAENERLKSSLEEASGNFRLVGVENQSFAQEIVGLKAKIFTLQEEFGSAVKERDRLTHEASCAREDKEQLKEAAENTSVECQKLNIALNEALAQKNSLENELREQISQLQAASVLKMAEIAELRAQVQESASTIEALQAQKANLEQEMLDEREKHEVLMQQNLQQVNEENQSKLADLRKRAENKLAQIKKQVVYDADKTKDELQAKIASLEEQKRQDDNTYSEKLAKERDNVKLEFQDKIARLEKSLTELQTALENERLSCFEEKETMIAELALKNSQIDESLLNAQENQTELNDRISILQLQLEQAEASLKTSESELVELRRQLTEKEELAQLLEAQLQSESESKASLNEDNRLRREHAVHLHEIQNEFGEKELSFEMALEEKEGIIQAKSAELERCSQGYEEKMDVMKTEHQRQMQELEKKWKAMLRKELKQQAAMHEEDVNGLTQEWQLERKELQQQTQLASSAIESGGQSSELLRRQIMTMQTQMEMLKDRHKAEVSELHQILQASNCPVPSGKSAGKGIFRDRPALQSLEIEYLKNILFEYMMGRETLTLAKVIATVVQFSDEQLNKILEKEESRGGGVSGQLGQIWK